MVGAQHRDRARQANVFRALCGRGEYDGRRGDGVVGAVVLAYAENIEPNLVGQFDLLEEVAQPMCRVDLGAHIGESVETKFHCRFLSAQDRCTRMVGDGFSALRRLRLRRHLTSTNLPSREAIEAPMKRYHDLSADVDLEMLQYATSPWFLRVEPRGIPTSVRYVA